MLFTPLHLFECLSLQIQIATIFIINTHFQLLKCEGGFIAFAFNDFDLLSVILRF